MKFSVALVLLVTIVGCLAVEDVSGKKNEKRGIYGFGYGHHFGGGPYYGGHHGGFGYPHYGYGHSYSHAHFSPGYYGGHGHGYYPGGGFGHFH